MVPPRGDNKVFVEFDAIDNVTPVANNIFGRGSFKGDILGASFQSFQEDLANGEMLFAPLIKGAENTENKIKKTSESLDFFNESFLRVGKEGISFSSTKLLTLEGAILGAGAAVLAVGKFALDSTQKFQEYGAAVGEIADKYDISTEFASRYLNVAKELNVSQGDLEKALTEVKKQGLDPAGEGFSELADELGITEQSLRDLTYAVDENLVLSEEMVKNAERQKNATDELKDAWDSFGSIVGEKVSPAVTGAAQSATAYLMILSDLGGAYDAILAGDFSSYIADIGREIVDATESTVDYTSVTEDSTEAMKDQAQAAKELSKEFKSQLDSMTRINKERENFEERTADLKDREQDLQDELVRENLAYGELINSGELTQKQIDNHIVKVDELQERLEENSQAQQKLAEDTIDASKQRIYATIEEGLAKDGLDQKEFEFLERYKVQQGLITQAAADRAIAERAVAEQAIADYKAQNAVLDTTQAKLDALVNGSPYNIRVNIEQTGSVPSVGSTGLSTSQNDIRRGRGYNSSATTQFFAQEVTKAQTSR